MGVESECRVQVGEDEVYDVRLSRVVWETYLRECLRNDGSFKLTPEELDRYPSEVKVRFSNPGGVLPDRLLYGGAVKLGGASSDGGVVLLIEPIAHLAAFKGRGTTNPEVRQRILTELLGCVLVHEARHVIQYIGLQHGGGWPRDRNPLGWLYRQVYLQRIPNYLLNAVTVYFFCAVPLAIAARLTGLVSKEDFESHISFIQVLTFLGLSSLVGRIATATQSPMEREAYRDQRAYIKSGNKVGFFEVTPL